MRYLTIRNWPRFQHYKDGRPLTWIKFYVALLDDHDLRSLPVDVRLLWDQLLLIAGRTDNRIPWDIKWLSEMTSLEHESVERGIRILLKGAWLRRFDSRRALEYTRTREGADARSREVEKEKTPQTPQRGASENSRKPRVTGWRLVRGSHGMTHVPDPFGTDRPPADARL